MEYGTQRLVMYPHLNAAGILFGGQALAWIDEEVIIYAANKLGTTRLALVKMSEVTFKSPANIGDILVIGTELIKIGRTSITVKCELKNKTTNKVIVTVDEVVMVALDYNKKPTPHGLPEPS
ncbi:acyl-CoA thioesterase [Malaciobacter mytili]|uniref:Acyl-CoA thioesterase n=1 Tax=Malaciobacter mytili LMG 24559 TaxID=1032238 RepID=A0AAX2AIQ9_9BACT|nr:hotdog domain-containing protein [Malaciobacter mytili]AXH15900.1 acyl-CoA thioesterase [Malaciobacter mytili LMG 24559]RXI46236.1 acyl-CoA thioesterase [Malaciobacter mytili]RXK15918.1 acyl-CoA thioesterase [Malaciobacter mytili LMG 24559]